MFLSIKDLSHYLQIKPSTLYAWASKGIIPHYKVQGLLRFRKDEIDAWISSFRKERLAPHIPSLKRKDHSDIDSLIERERLPLDRPEGLSLQLQLSILFQGRIGNIGNM